MKGSINHILTEIKLPKPHLLKVLLPHGFFFFFHQKEEQSLDKHWNITMGIE